MEEETRAKVEEQAPEQQAVCCCPVCGGVYPMPSGEPMRLRRMRHWAGMPWGGMGMWGMHMKPWGMGMAGFTCIGSALLGLMVGFLMGSKSYR